MVFNATFDDMPRKRHELLLRLLLHPDLLDLKALFLGRGRPSNVDKFAAKVRELGLDSRVTIMANLRRSEVPLQLNRCKMGVHLSLYENACRSIYEFFRADLPCVVSSSMGGMNLSLFNAKTGKAVGENDLPEAIAFVLKHRQEFRPREWFVEHSGSINSTRMLNSALRTYFTCWGYEWRQDIVPLVSSGANRYRNAADYQKFRPEFEWLLELMNSHKRSPLNLSIE